jgi:hypothetical protein
MSDYIELAHLDKIIFAFLNLLFLVAEYILLSKFRIQLVLLTTDHQCPRFSSIPHFRYVLKKSDFVLILLRVLSLRHPMQVRGLPIDQLFPIRYNTNHAPNQSLFPFLKGYSYGNASVFISRIARYCYRIILPKPSITQLYIISSLNMLFDELLLFTNGDLIQSLSRRMKVPRIAKVLCG